MRNTLRSSIAAALVGAVTLASLNITPALAASKTTPAASPTASAATTDISARRFHRGNGAAALAMFGLVAGGIAAAAAADNYGYGPYYGGPYAYAGPGYYGWHHHWHRWHR